MGDETRMLFGAVKRLLRHNKRDARHFVSMSPRATEVASLAEELAYAGREDQAAVAQLIAAAGGDKKALEKAFQRSRIGGYQHEQQFANRGWRLLSAALADGPVPPVSDEDLARIEAIQTFRKLPLADRWAYLIAREPRLGKLEEDVKRGAYGSLDISDGSGDVTSEEIVAADGTRLRKVTRSVSSSSADPMPEESAEERERLLQVAALHAELWRIVGPESNHRDAVMGSSAASGSAYKYLELKAPA